MNGIAVYSATVIIGIVVYCATVIIGIVVYSATVIIGIVAVYSATVIIDIVVYSDMFGLFWRLFQEMVPKESDFDMKRSGFGLTEGQTLEKVQDYEFFWVLIGQIE